MLSVWVGWEMPDAKAEWKKCIVGKEIFYRQSLWDIKKEKGSIWSHRKPLHHDTGPMCWADNEKNGRLDNRTVPRKSLPGKWEARTKETKQIDIATGL